MRKQRMPRRYYYGYTPRELAEYGFAYRQETAGIGAYYALPVLNIIGSLLVALVLAFMSVIPVNNLTGRIITHHSLPVPYFLIACAALFVWCIIVTIIVKLAFGR